MTVTSEQLYELTDVINDTFNEFERDGVPVFRTLMPGQVRLILAAYDAWRAERDAPSAPNPSWKRGYEEGYADAIANGDAPVPDNAPHGYYVSGNGTLDAPLPADKYIQGGVKLVNSEPVAPTLSPEAQTPLVPRRLKPVSVERDLPNGDAGDVGREGPSLSQFSPRERSDEGPAAGQAMDT